MSNTDRDSITGRQLTPEGKKMDYSTKETEEININSVIQKRKKEQRTPTIYDCQPSKK